jgi:hypothetical protein
MNSRFHEMLDCEGERIVRRGRIISNSNPEHEICMYIVRQVISKENVKGNETRQGGKAKVGGETLERKLPPPCIVNALMWG